MEDQDHHRELQLLPTPHYSIASSSSNMNFDYPFEGGGGGGGATGLDLQLSISLRPFHSPQLDHHRAAVDSGSVKALKWHASEQIRLASIEKAYAERVRELTRREMELAQSEFARARHMWERAKEEVDKAERMKERATCMAEEEITCRSCRQRFRPPPQPPCGD